jgi:hypothetical protein
MEQTGHGFGRGSVRVNRDGRPLHGAHDWALTRRGPAVGFDKRTARVLRTRNNPVTFPGVGVVLRSKLSQGSTSQCRTDEGLFGCSLKTRADSGRTPAPAGGSFAFGRIATIPPGHGQTTLFGLNPVAVRNAGRLCQVMRRSANGSSGGQE